MLWLVWALRSNNRRTTWKYIPCLLVTVFVVHHSYLKITEILKLVIWHLVWYMHEYTYIPVGQAGSQTLTNRGIVVNAKIVCPLVTNTIVCTSSRIPMNHDCFVRWCLTAWTADLYHCADEAFTTILIAPFPVRAANYPQAHLHNSVQYQEQLKLNTIWDWVWQLQFYVSLSLYMFLLRTTKHYSTITGCIHFQMFRFFTYLWLRNCVGSK